MTRTTVITVNYQSELDTEKCIQSIQSTAPDISVVVVDNSAQHIDLEKKLAVYSNVRLIKSPENVGFGRGNNMGIRWALANTKDEFLFLLNNDAMVVEKTITRLEQEIDLDPAIGCVTPRILLMDDPHKLWYGGGDISWFRGKPVIPGFLGPPNATMALLPRDVSFASGCAMLLRRSVLEQIGGFDPFYFMYQEDLELCLRMLKAHWRIRYVPEAIVFHKGHGSQKTMQTFIGGMDPHNPALNNICFHMTRNTFMTMYKHARRIDFVKFLFGFHLRCCVQSIRYAAAGNYQAVRAMFRGYLSFLRNRKQKFVNELA